MLDKNVSELFRAKALAKVLEDKIESLKQVVSEELLSLGTYSYKTKEGKISHRSGSVSYKFSEEKLRALPEDDPDRIAYEMIVSNPKYTELKTTRASWTVSATTLSLEQAAKEIESILFLKEEK